ncbi:uncharacterized protein [Littorina saxatilis]|uniref:C-type lectin n=1 Tax=Littorina saxatilis TaxID=31220 RepID=A0AAN9BFJ6_9CAEN
MKLTTAMDVAGRMISFLLAILLHKGECQVTLSSLSKISAVDDFIFADDVLFDVTTRSGLQCALRCVAIADCASFTYHRTAAVTSCRGYTTMMTPSSPKMSATGARSYSFVGPRCPVSEGFTHHAPTGMCYRITTLKVTTFDQGRPVCPAQGTHLITLDTERKVNALLHGGVFQIDTPYLIGVECLPDSGSTKCTYPAGFKWTRTGQRVATTEYFIDQHYVANCVLTFVQNDTFQWVQMPCDHTVYPLPLICELV